MEIASRLCHRLDDAPIDSRDIYDAVSATRGLAFEEQGVNQLCQSMRILQLGFYKMGSRSFQVHHLKRGCISRGKKGNGG